MVLLVYATYEVFICVLVRASPHGLSVRVGVNYPYYSHEQVRDGSVVPQILSVSRVHSNVVKPAWSQFCR